AAPDTIDFNPPGPPGGRDCCECGPDRPCTSRKAWSRQHPDLRIAEGDLIADCNNAGELLNLCRHRGIDTLVCMGVASNICVL
ncbi:MAG: isochorismatase, partial [Planctomycetales bacterium]|nr:isochorismatase [Planctomycetales bacterium]